MFVGSQRLETRTPSASPVEAPAPADWLLHSQGLDLFISAKFLSLIMLDYFFLFVVACAPRRGTRGRPAVPLVLHRPSDHYLRTWLVPVAFSRAGCHPPCLLACFGRVCSSRRVFTGGQQLSSEVGVIGRARRGQLEEKAAGEPTESSHSQNCGRPIRHGSQTPDA